MYPRNLHTFLGAISKKNYLLLDCTFFYLTIDIDESINTLCLQLVNHKTT